MNLQSHQTSNVANVSQRAALAAVSGDLSAVAEMRTAFERRGRVMHEMLAAIPGVTCIEPEGAFYCFPSFEGVLGREIGGRVPGTTLELCEVLLEEAKVAIVPGEAFGAPGYARLSFALGDDALVEGVQRIAKILSMVDCCGVPASGHASAASPLLMVDSAAASRPPATPPLRLLS